MSGGAAHRLRRWRRRWLSRLRRHSRLIFNSYAPRYPAKFYWNPKKGPKASVPSTGETREHGGSAAKGPRGGCRAGRPPPCLAIHLNRCCAPRASTWGVAGAEGACGFLLIERDPRCVYAFWRRVQVILEGNVYDLAAFAKVHPGGGDLLHIFGGSDATPHYYMLHQHQQLRTAALEPYKVCLCAHTEIHHIHITYTNTRLATRALARNPNPKPHCSLRPTTRSAV